MSRPDIAKIELLRSALSNAVNAFEVYAKSVESHYTNKYDISNDLRIQASLVKRVLDTTSDSIEQPKITRKGKPTRRLRIKGQTLVRKPEVAPIENKPISNEEFIPEKLKKALYEWMMEVGRPNMGKFESEELYRQAVLYFTE